MTLLRRSALALLLVGSASCVASSAQYPPAPPPSAPPDSRYPSNPGYQQPGYQQPGYQQPGYQQPGYQPGYGYDDPRDAPDYEVGFFYNELSPYGDWIYTNQYGWSWLPRNVSYGWRPYMHGQWVWSEYGWFWASYEPFGWATYHYGRWALDPRFGWIWLPGQVWGPSWVSWQYGQGYVGWAPLPPEVGFSFGIGLQLGGFNLSVGLSPSHYNFVDERHFLASDIDRYYVPQAQNVSIIRNTTNITKYSVVNNQVVNQGVDFQRIERATGQKVRQHRIAAESETAKARSEVRGDVVEVYKPPQQRVATVKVDESKPNRGRSERKPKVAEGKEQRGGGRGPSDRAADVEVAPRVQGGGQPAREERADVREQRERKEKQEVEQFERQERQKLERAQQDEKAKAPKSNAADVERRHQQEKKALEDDLQRSKQQLEARQEVERKAEQAKPQEEQKGNKKPAKKDDKIGRAHV